MYATPFHNIDISNKTIVVTGAAGFIGSNIVEYLLKYNVGKVIAIDNLATGHKENLEPFIDKTNFTFLQLDITNEADLLTAFKGVDYIIHQAALGSVPRSIEFPLATNHANVTGFVTVLNAARQAGVKRIVYASSSSVYGDSKILPKEESVIGNPLSPYAVSKLVDEFYGSVFARTYNMEIIGLRYFNIFGPNQSPSGAYAAAIPLFLNALMNGKQPSIFGDGEQSRDFTFVENAVQANIKAMCCDVKFANGDVFNIAYGKRITLNELLKLIGEKLNVKVNAEYKAERKGDVRDSLANIDKAKNAFGYNPEISIEQGLQPTIEWFKQKFNL